MTITHLPEDGKRFIEYELTKNTIDFNDGELMFNIAKKERDYAVTVDICMDYTGSLVIGTGTGKTYVAQLHIPERKYTEEETTVDGEASITMVPVPFDVNRCELILWEMEV